MLMIIKNVPEMNDDLKVQTHLNSRDMTNVQPTIAFTKNTSSSYQKLNNDSNSPEHLAAMSFVKPAVAREQHEVHDDDN